MMPSPKSSTLLASGVLIDKKYRLLRQIGEGAMGVVWAAVNVATAREVALKLIHRPETEFRLRLQREARNCGALRHRNVIDIYDMGETEAGEPFLVMQLLTGETVAELLARRRRLDPPVAASIGRDVARGLAAAHAMSIIHRDLKPANIFLHREPDMDEPVVKVLDFGVAKNLSVNDGLHTVQGGAVGSPLYMSPEQVRAEPNVDHRADIWALGVVLFEMLTGMRPFQGDAQAVFMGILTGEIPTVSRYVRRVDQGLVDLIARCMRRDRAERISSAAEVAALLDRYAAHGVGAGSDAELRHALSEAQGQPGPASVAGSPAAQAPIAEPDPASAGALPLALLGGGPRAPVPVPDAGVPSALGPWQAAVTPQARGAIQATDAAQVAGAASRRQGSSAQIIAAPPSGRASWEDDMPTLPMTRGHAAAAAAAGQRVATGQHPAVGPQAAAQPPPPAAASAASGLNQASAGQPSPAATPPRGSWGSTVRMSPPAMLEPRAGAGGSGLAVAPTPGSSVAPSSPSLGSTVMLATEAGASASDSRPGASASDSRPGATEATGVPRQAGSSSTTPLISNHPSVHQTGAPLAQVAQDPAPRGGDPRRKRAAATLALVAAALSLILVGMFIAMRSGETSPATSALPEGSATPLVNSAGGDMGAAPENGGALPRIEAPPAPPLEAPPGSAASASPVPPGPAPTSSAGAAAGGDAGAAAGGNAGAAAGGNAGAAAGGNAGAAAGGNAGAAAVGNAGAAASAGGAAASTGTAGSAKPGGSTQGAATAASRPPATSQLAKPPAAADPCAGRMFLDKKKCEAKHKK
ncbi:protein kinase domain-containing protein [Sorangium sp. So ce1000]|uniref:serine/threonine-protein kinase n=1 Tax=Sorangium sp. So ce1000 TaxID=3133325 RepID=UPI003F64733A